MGRQTTIHNLHIYDRHVTNEGQKRIRISKSFMEKMGKRYNIDTLPLSFDKDGMLLYNNKYKNIDIRGDIDKLATIILRIARRYKRKITGNFNYTDDQTGGSYSGVVYILDDNSALVNQFNTDGSYTSSNFQDALEQTIIKISKKHDNLKEKGSLFESKTSDKTSKKHDDLKVSELKKMAREKGIKGYSKMKKSELCEALNI